MLIPNSSNSIQLNLDTNLYDINFNLYIAPSTTKKITISSTLTYPIEVKELIPPFDYGENFENPFPPEYEYHFDY